MSVWFFVSDLHGHLSKYRKLWQLILAERPAAVLMGGDLLPHGLTGESEGSGEGFIHSVLLNGFERVKKQLTTDYPQVLLILGNDDLRAEESAVVQAEGMDLWTYIHFRKVEIGAYSVYGYACVPPTPFMLKDWERYDVSRFVDPGCISPEDGWRSFPISEHEIRHGTIQADLARLVSDTDLSQSIFLFHAPPHGTALDRAALDGRVIDSVLLDVHVGSIAIRRFIMDRQPRLTLHGHIHESARLTGAWHTHLGQTWAFSAAHDGAELALVRFDPADPASAIRELL
jgi:Icc-related predicted phosphoesterase